MSFKTYLEQSYSELLLQATELDIKVSAFSPIYDLYPQEAVKALRNLVGRKQKEVAKVDHISTFVENNRSLINRFYKARNELATRVDEYNQENDATLRINFGEEDEGNIISNPRSRKGERSPRGVRKYRPKEKDFETFVEYATEIGYGIDQLRVEIEEGNFVYGAFSDEGKVEHDGTTFDTAAQFVGSVRGTRQGSPYKVIKVQNPAKEWVTLDAAYKAVMQDKEPEEEIADNTS